MAFSSPNSHPAPSGYKRLTIEIRAEDHARFKSICALHGTTMGHEINTMIAAQLADPDALLSEALYVRVSPQLKQELIGYAKERHVNLTDLLIESFGLLQRQHEPVDLAVSRITGRIRGGREYRHCRLAAQGR
jgi:hypothetical protein